VKLHHVRIDLAEANAFVAAHHRHHKPVVGHDDEDDESAWHFWRTCKSCGKKWAGLHCPHDGYQNPCPWCREMPASRRGPQPMKKEKPFKTEVDLCIRFIKAIGDDWISYAETGGWDILLVRKADGFQIGIQAKLRLGVDVINQAIEDGYRAANPGPDCRAVLVPMNEKHGFGSIAAWIGFTIIEVHGEIPPGGRTRWGRYDRVFEPALPKIDREYWHSDWHELCPAARHALPAYVPDVAAGAPSPIQLTDWKIKALKIAATLELRGYVTRHDFKHLGIDYRRWISPGYKWLKAEDGRYIADRYFPSVRTDHPIVYEQIKVDADKWMLADPQNNPAKHKVLL
jgi:hypothetical protein